MNKSLSEISGWALICSTGLSVIGLLVGIVLIFARLEAIPWIYAISTVSNVLFFVVIYAMTSILAEHEGAISWVRGAGGALGILIRIVARTAEFTGAIDNGTTNDLLMGGGLLFGFWLAWVNWQMWRNALLKGALPWIGVAYGTVYLMSAYADSLPTNTLSTILVVLSLPLMLTWNIWFGLRLTRGQVTINAGEPV